ncbi:MAG: hypothetical protein Q4B17_00965 [Lautropia sp.]|nr:hypothetical protein [Lautropia sp.]
MGSSRAYFADCLATVSYPAQVNSLSGVLCRQQQYRLLIGTDLITCFRVFGGCTRCSDSFRLMPTSAFASLLIAFVAAAGAVPLLRDLLRGRPALRSAGGWAMSLGVLVAAFYSDPWPVSDHGLVFGAVSLLAAGLWFDHRQQPSVGAGVGARRVFEILGSLVAAIFLFGYLDHDRVTWSVGFMMLAAVSLILPVATAALARLPTSTPALPAFMVLVQLLLLLAFGALNAAGGSRYSLYGEFAIVAVPVIGALMGCLIYLSSMPWRPQAGIAIGAGGLLALGLLVSWGILRLGSITAEVLGGTTALLWLVAVPILELMREWLLVRGLAWLVDARWLQRPAWAGIRRALPALCRTHYSPAALVIVQVLFGLSGIALCALQASGYLMTLLLLLLAVAYMALPVLVSQARPSSSNRLLQGMFPRHGGDRV